MFDEKSFHIVFTILFVGTFLAGGWFVLLFVNFKLALAIFGYTICAIGALWMIGLLWVLYDDNR